MNVLEAVFLGVLQGVTEFLPVSSSGHLVLAEYFLNLKEAGLAFDVILHMGTLVAVIAYFYRDWLSMARALFFLQESRQRGKEAAFFLDSRYSAGSSCRLFA